MTFNEEVICALRNAAEVAIHVEDVGVEGLCPNALIIKALNLTALGDVLIKALDLTWRVGLPIDTPASTVFRVAYDRFVCEQLESSFGF